MRQARHLTRRWRWRIRRECLVPECFFSASRKPSDFLEYDFYCVATAAAFCRTTERAIDLAHPQTRHTTNGRPHLRLAQEIARADDHETILTEHAHRDVAHSAG